jgi:S1-C subfamily serine protease
MKIAAGISGIAAFLSAIALLSLGDARRSVRELQAHHARSEATLGRARIEFEQLRLETAAGLRALAAVAAPQDLRDPAALQRDILGPSVQVNVQGSVGGGTLLFSRETHSYVVTAHHVIHRIIVGHDAETRPPAEVTLYTDAGAIADTVEGDLVAWDERKDLALLRLRAVHEYRTVARLASRDTLRSVRVFTPIYAVGCPLGHDPLPTPGEVATLNKELNGERFWMMNAPTIFGNSGGGVFHRETRELIGVSVMVCTYDGAVSTPVPHLGIMVSLETVYDWLDSLNYNFIYDPEFPLEAFENLRTNKPFPSPRPEPSTPAPTGSVKRP